MDRKMKMGTVAFLALILLVVGVWAYTSWSGTISWNVPVEDFSVWDSSEGGTEIGSPYMLDLDIVSPGLQTFDFYIENDGDTEITVNVQVIAETGCTPSWSSTGSYVVPVGSGRTLATLTLDITNTGSYSWDFTVT